MIEIQQSDLIEGETYYIGAYGPNGLIRKHRGVYNNTDLPFLLRFDDVIKYENGKSMPDSGMWFHTPSTSYDSLISSSQLPKYYWKYFKPCCRKLKQKVKYDDTVIMLTKMILLRQEYCKLYGDASTIQGMIQHRFGQK